MGILGHFYMAPAHNAGNHPQSLADNAGRDVHLEGHSFTQGRRPPASVEQMVGFRTGVCQYYFAIHNIWWVHVGFSKVGKVRIRAVAAPAC